MLTSKQRSKLKYYCHSTNLVHKYIVGKDYLKDTTIDMLKKAIFANELIKISVLKSVEESINETASLIAQKLECDVVQVIGKTILLYKKNPQMEKPIFII